MKIPILVVLMLLSGIQAVAQESPIFMVNPMNDDLVEFEKKLYKYKNFVDGLVLFKDSTAGKGRMNYHRFFDQVHFISEKGDTLTLKDPGAIRVIAIGRDSFYYSGKGYIQKLSFHEKLNLAVKPAIQYVGKEKKGLYGTYNEVASIDELSTFTPDEFRTFYLGQDANLKFRYRNIFYFADRFNNFFPASKASLGGLFPGKEEVIREFVTRNQIDFSKEDHLLQLVYFLQDL